jgi:hypothetical protein
LNIKDLTGPYLQLFIQQRLNVTQEDVIIKNGLLPGASKMDRVSFSGNTFTVTDSNDAAKYCTFQLDQKTEHGHTVFVIKKPFCTKLYDQEHMVIYANAPANDSLDLYIKETGKS